MCTAKSHLGTVVCLQQSPTWAQLYVYSKVPLGHSCMCTAKSYLGTVVCVQQSPTWAQLYVYSKVPIGHSCMCTAKSHLGTVVCVQQSHTRAQLYVYSKVPLGHSCTCTANSHWLSRITHQTHTEAEDHQPPDGKRDVRWPTRTGSFQFKCEREQPPKHSNAYFLLLTHTRCTDVVNGETCHTEAQND